MTFDTEDETIIREIQALTVIDDDDVAAPSAEQKRLLYLLDQIDQLRRELEDGESTASAFVEIVHDTLWSEQHRAEDVGEMAMRVKRERDEAVTALAELMRVVHIPHESENPEVRLQALPERAQAMGQWLMEGCAKMMRAEMEHAPPDKRNRMTARIVFGDDLYTLTLARGDFDHAIEKQRDQARAAYAVLRDATQDFFKHVIQHGPPSVPDRVYIALHQHALAAEWPTSTRYIVERAEVEGGRWISRIGQYIELIARELQGAARRALETSDDERGKVVFDALMTSAQMILTSYPIARADEQAELTRKLCEAVLNTRWAKDDRVLVFDAAGYGVRPTGERVGDGSAWVRGRVEFVVDGASNAPWQLGHVSVYCDDGRGRRIVPPWEVRSCVD